MSKKAGFWELFSLGSINGNWVHNNLRFFLFIGLLILIYITNAHFAEKKVRTIQEMNKNLKELRWEYKTQQAELMRMSKQTEISEEIAKTGLVLPTKPPFKIDVEN